MSSACMLNEKVYRVMFRRQINFSLCKDKQLFLLCYINTCSNNLVEECILPLFSQFTSLKRGLNAFFRLETLASLSCKCQQIKMTLKTCSDKILIEG